MSAELPEWMNVFMGLEKPRGDDAEESLPYIEPTHKSKISKGARKSKRRDRALARKFKKGL